MKYSSLFPFYVNGVKLTNQFFTYGNIKTLDVVISKENPDILILQEIPDMAVAEHLRERYEYSYVRIHTSYQHAHNICVLSNISLEKRIHVKGEYSNYYMYSGIIDGVYIDIIPVHLHAFSSNIRKLQCRELVSPVMGDDVLLLGDFNFWEVFGRTLFDGDRYAQNYIQQKFIGSDAGVASTTSGISMDRVYISKESKRNISSYVIPIRGTYMDHYPIVSQIAI